MADNRLLIRCRRCQVDIPIARFGAGADAWEASRVTHHAWDTWLETHTQCGDGMSLDVELTAETDFYLSGPLKDHVLVEYGFIDQDTIIRRLTPR